jgi:hypothetical protein
MQRPSGKIGLLYLLAICDEKAHLHVDAEQAVPC